MECPNDTAEELTRYAFFLGSALRNEDADQFTEIYDNIIPKELSQDKVTFYYYLHAHSSLDPS